jgi:hypothetical protein
MADTENQHCLDHTLAQLLADTSAVERVDMTILQHLPWERRLLAGRSWKSSAQTTARNKERVVSGEVKGQGKKARQSHCMPSLIG